MLSQRMKQRVLPGNQSNAQDLSHSSYHQKLAPLLHHLFILTLLRIRATYGHLSVWQIILQTGTSSYLLTLLHRFLVQWEKDLGYILMLSSLQAVIQFHLQWLLKVLTELCLDQVSSTFSFPSWLTYGKELWSNRRKIMTFGDVGMWNWDFWLVKSGWLGWRNCSVPSIWPRMCSKVISVTPYWRSQEWKSQFLFCNRPSVSCPDIVITKM